MAIKINTALQNALLDRTLGNPGASPPGVFDGGVLEIYDGVQPADANTAVGAQVLLASLPMAASAFNAAAGGVADMAAQIQDAAANAGGTASWFRLRDAGDTMRIDGDVSTSGAALNLSTTTIVLNGVVTVTALSLTHPA